MTVLTTKYFPYVAYGFVALCLLAALFLPGYILTLDMVFVPHTPWPAAITNSFVFEALLHVIGFVVPGDVLQKIILLAFFLFAGLGAHRLVTYLSLRLPEPHIPGSWQPHVWHWAAYSAGIFYIFNPFVYGRFMAGQYLVLLGYMLLPYFLRALLEFLDTPTLKRAIPVSVYLLLISIVSIHSIGLALLLAIVAGGIALWHQRDDRDHLLAIIRYGALGFGGVVIASSYWLAPLLLGVGATATAISGFDHTHAAAFATDGGLFHVLMLKGFWVEAQGLFTPSDALLPLSGVVQFGVWAVIITGIVSLWRRVRMAAILLLLVAGIAAVAALSQPLMQAVAQTVPLFAGYREPHKFVAIVAVAFSVFFGFGVAAILQKMTSYKKQALFFGVAALLLVLPIINTPTMLRNFNGQLAPRAYPADWHDINEQLNRDPGHAKVLFLPWHMYLSFAFSGRIIANPADKYFDAPVVVSENLEFAHIPSSTRDTAKRTLETDILPGAADHTNLGERLTPLGIKYILLAKNTTDASAYDYLTAQTDLHLVAETETLKLYRNTHFGESDASN